MMRLKDKEHNSDLHIISKIIMKLPCWQEMFNPHPEVSTPAFCAESPEAESVN